MDLQVHKRASVRCCTVVRGVWLPQGKGFVWASIAASGMCYGVLMRNIDVVRKHIAGRLDVVRHIAWMCHIVNAYVAHLQGQPFAPVGVEKQSFASGLPSLLLVSLLAPS